MTERAPDVRPTWGEVDLGAVRANTRRLAALADPAALLAVVKADGYGHGAVPVARAALDAGASWLGVALVEEGTALRHAGIDAPILVLSEPPAAAADVVVDAHLTPVVYTEPGIEALAKAVADRAADDPLPVHLKVDTGMHRVGCEPRRRPQPRRRDPRPARAAPRGDLHPLRGRRRARPARDRPAARRVPPPRHRPRGGRGPPPDRPRRQLGRAPAVPRRPLRPGPRRHRALRRRPRPVPHGHPRPGPVAARPGHLRQGAPRRRPRLLRAALRPRGARPGRDRPRRLRRRRPPQPRAAGR